MLEGDSTYTDQLKLSKGKIVLNPGDELLKHGDINKYVTEMKNINQIHKKLSFKGLNKKYGTFNDVLSMYCFQCKQVFVQTSATLFKCKKCNKKVQFQCTKCLVLFNDICPGYLHIKSNCKIYPGFECSDCDFKISFKKSLLKHNMSEHINLKKKTETLKCSKCRRKYRKPESFKAHLEKCNTFPSFQCSSCSFTNKQKKILRRHFESQHTDNITQAICSICQKEYEHSQLYIHKTAHNLDIDKTTTDYERIFWKNTLEIQMKYILMELQNKTK